MKKKLIMEKLRNKNYIRLWICFHLFVILFFLIRLIFSHGQFGIDSDFFNITPRNMDSAPISKADEKLTSTTGNNVFILVENPSFEKARDAAEKVYDQLKTSDNFLSVSLFNDISTYSDVTDFIFKYRWNLLDEDFIALINSDGGPESFSNVALSKVFSPFTLTSLDRLEEDPFMLGETNLTNYLMSLKDSGTAMSVKDNVLASFNDGKWYIMIRGVLSKKGNVMASTKNGVNEIFDVCLPLEDGETKFIFSGTPYHSNESSLAASKEIKLISIVSLVFVLLMLIFIFRSPIPILCSVLSIGLSAGIAFLTTMAVFNKVMLLTLVFGTSLIGSSIDYSLHFFTHWAGNPNLKFSGDIKKHLLSGLTMAILSTGLCYAILLFAPFQLLKQISLFSLTGLLSSFLTTISIYPLLPLPSGERKLKISYLYSIPKRNSKRRIVAPVFVATVFIASILILIIQKNNVGIENDISRLYTMNGRLLDNEIQASKIIQYSPTGWFIVSGDSENDVLSNEETFRNLFETETHRKGGYLSTTLFVPSIEKQKRSREACKRLLAISEQQYISLGLSPEYAKELLNEFELSENDFISFENENIPQYLTDSISSVHLGKINDKYYTVIMPNMTADEHFFYSLADKDDNIHFVSKRSDISNSLDRLTKMVLLFFAIAYVIMFFVLRIFYSWKQSLKIISIPVLITLVTAAVFALTKTKLEFFSVTGLILVFGLGLDYIIYMIENEKNTTDSRLEPFATTLSFLTTLISFGALAVSSFRPVHLIGLAISIGLTTAYVCSKCLSKK